MLRSLIAEVRSELRVEAEEPADDPAPAAAEKPKRKNKHDRAAHKIGHLLGTPPHQLSRKKMLKMVPHMMHHFEKGHGAGEGDYRIHDADDLATLSRHAENISAHAHGMTRMPGPAHHMSSHLCKHVANAHDRMSKYWKDQGNEESAELHSKHAEKFHALCADHKKKARRHGLYDGEY